MKKLLSLITFLLLTCNVSLFAQSEIYPEHFNLNEVTLLDSPFKTAMEINDSLLLQYDVDRLLTPFIRQAGLSDDINSKYYGWVKNHPSFSNWGLDSWSLEGHIGGHYLTALALAYAATDDINLKNTFKSRLDYMLEILKDCQDVFDENTQGMEGFIGGQPINDVWTGLYAGNLTNFQTYGGWVPFYCQHKVLAGLRDAYLYTGSEMAKTLYKKLCDWSVNVVSNLSTSQMQNVLGWEHGGMNETLVDAYRIFSDETYLTAAKKYCHKEMVTGMQTLNETFLDGKHANTQVPKYIGFERIYQEELRSSLTPTEDYHIAAHNFWDDVALNRTVCIGGNSVSEAFLASSNCSKYITTLDGPESCNTNNMLKLSEDLFDETHDAKYVDFYENAMWNHILSTQDPQTGGYVYFTTLRPQGYRIYSQANQGMWCCVGTGMENHSKYGHFIYTHNIENDTLFVNLFTASILNSEIFALTQQTNYPYSQKSTITINKSANFTLAIRHPAWTNEEYSITVNEEKIQTTLSVGTSGFETINREWKEGDVIEINVPMELRYEVCPNYEDYISFKYGPILLAAQTTATDEEDANNTGLFFEELQNEYAGEGRMDHSPGSMAKSLDLSSAPLLIGGRDTVLNRISKTEEPLVFLIDAESEEGSGKWKTLTLKPFYDVHHSRYSIYWYQRTSEEYAQSDMGKKDAEAAAINDRTLDFVAPGEQQSEAGHDASYSSTSSTGTYALENYRDVPSGGYIQYTLQNTSGKKDSVSIMCRFTTADAERTATIFIDGKKLVDVCVPSNYKHADSYGFYDIEYAIPEDLMLDEEGNIKTQLVFRLEATGTSYAPGLYYLRLLSGHEDSSYHFVASEWKTGDAGRVTQANISYDTNENTISVNAGTGNNNVCLMLDYENTDYTVTSDKGYMLVRGSDLKTGSGKSYLWWLNGMNEGSSVSPTITKKMDDGDVIVAWLLSSTGLNKYCKGDTWNISTGETIFGLTASSGTAIIKDINFVTSVDDYIEALGIKENTVNNANTTTNVYDLQGQLVKKNTNINNIKQELSHGIYIVGDRKINL